MDDPRAKRKLISFIHDSSWDAFEPEVQTQAIKCALDLFSVICAGAKNKSAKTMSSYVSKTFSRGCVTVLSTGEKTNLVGAAMANGMAANALDLDDGYSMLRGHPGSGFFGALVSAAEQSKCTYGQFLAALIVSYEISIRQGYAIRDFYKWDHSTGSYSTFGVAAGVSKLLGLNEHEIEMALGIADFIMPVNPAKRSCYVPSNNKDGVYWGTSAGVQAVVMAQTGITGCNPVILDDEYIKHIDTLGERFYFFDLYIKFFSCCRWAHSPICAILGLRQQHSFSNADIAKIDVYSFGYAGTLYKGAPTCEDEAQYNIKYPLAAVLLFGDCGPLESSTSKMRDARIPELIEKIEFHQEPRYDAVFPGKRFSRVCITLKSGQTLESADTEPLGDCNADVSIEDLVSKAKRINGIYAPDTAVDEMVRAILHTNPSAPFEDVYRSVKALAALNVHPEIEFV